MTVLGLRRIAPANHLTIRASIFIGFALMCLFTGALGYSAAQMIKRSAALVVETFDSSLDVDRLCQGGGGRFLLDAGRFPAASSGDQPGAAEATRRRIECAGQDILRRSRNQRVAIAIRSSAAGGGDCKERGGWLAKKPQRCRPASCLCRKFWRSWMPIRRSSTIRSIC